LLTPSPLPLQRDFLIMLPTMLSLVELVIEFLLLYKIDWDIIPYWLVRVFMPLENVLNGS